MASFATFFDPTGAFDGQESSDLVPFLFHPTAESCEWSDTAGDDGVESGFLEHIGSAERKDLYVELKSFDDGLGDFGFLGNAIAKGDIQVGS